MAIPQLFEWVEPDPPAKGSINAGEWEIIEGDCETVLTEMPADSVDLILTSPPYASQRVKTYGGVSPDAYVEWFMPIAEKMQRVLKPSGSLILNIKEHAENGERHTYVLMLILAMRQQEWRWVEEYVWHKKTSVPGKWPNRFRDAWERLLHFTLNSEFAMYQTAVMQPVGEWRKNPASVRGERHYNNTGSGFQRRKEAWVDRQMVYPSNVLHLAGETSNQSHSAAFPESLPDWFVRLFTLKGDTVLDPFAGSGTTLVAASQLGRNSIGIELDAEHCQIARKRLAKLSG